MLGTTIAHYKITAKLGQGGMGEVYRATDTKLDREVAIKVLPESFAVDKERLARFEREAKTLATLNHPNIAGIFGLEESANSQALVLELVDGDDLSDVLKRGPLPIEEVLDICKQIAEALEAAHDKGIIHRDLKPSNIKITSDGQVKVLDFGLAKSAPAIDNDFDADSPTITADYTLPGTLLGTAGYMSPEQARGKTVDKRSDIWSFGVVLFECLTGKRMFTGETVTDSIGALLHREIEWDQLPTNTPPAIELLLRKCLERDRKRRLPDIGAARLDLELAIADPESTFLRRREGVAEKESKPNDLSIATIVGVAIVAIALTWLLKPAPPLPPDEPRPIRRLSIDLGAQTRLAIDRGPALQISPDGTTLAYIGRSIEDPTIDRILYIRRLNNLKPYHLEETKNVNWFCFSPNGQTIAFITGYGRLQTISVNGESAQPLFMATNDIRSIHWGKNGQITLGQLRGPLLQISSSGEEPKPITFLSDEEVTHRLPQILPDERAVLFTSHNKINSGFEEAKIMVQPIPDGKPQLIKKGVFDVRYLSSGHLVYMDNGRLFAAAFNLDTLSIQGESVPVVEDILYNDGGGGGHFDVSSEGTLVYVKGRTRKKLFELVWVDRDGRPEKLDLPEAEYGGFRLSPDGKFLAYGLVQEGQEDLWIYDLERKVIHSRLTSTEGDEFFPVWSPSGKSIAFVSNRDGGNRNIYWKRVDESGNGTLLYETLIPNLQIWSWHPTLNHLVMLERNQNGNIQYLPITGDDQSGWTPAGEPKNLVATQHSETHAMLSPNGKWFSYHSRELMGSQVFVQGYPPNGSAKRRVSIVNSSSVWSFWHPNKAEFFFTSHVVSSGTLRQVYSLNYHELGDDLKFEDTPAKPWKGATHYHLGGTLSADYDPSHDRLLLRQLVEEDTEPENDLNHLVVFENFFDYLNEKVPVEPPKK